MPGELDDQRDRRVAADVDGPAAGMHEVEDEASDGLAKPAAKRVPMRRGHRAEDKAFREGTGQTGRRRVHSAVGWSDRTGGDLEGGSVWYHILFRPGT
jgi:hypothetical protein